ncbi:oxygen-insensitive NAD(P)H nitroreductase [Marinobacterium mangrovicola]|uniref:Dihydropteridine reductase n=1 Tax=Marinobacterium mangrovicola TaxID=1476959 RepID=A0A4R1GIH5_9GAMM|nr:oxygen-insensitive NAD(P)H nitroreductase [Marinobacterium mangrovicola]TCK04062.1 dihydropteridine reductase [Marinobacterium mangrovicola]
MSIVDAARARYTTKAFDPSKKIPESLAADLLETLRLSASSTNSQPWHFVVAKDDAGKARIAKGTQGTYAFNEGKVKNASHVLVFCAPKEVSDEHLWQVTEQEAKDGRYPSDEVKTDSFEKRKFFRNLHRDAGPVAESAWAAKQLYLALGSLLLAAAAEGVDACPIEGFDPEALDAELGLSEKGLTSLVIVALGYRDADADFNVGLSKSRLSHEVVFTEL